MFRLPRGLKVPGLQNPRQPRTSVRGLLALRPTPREVDPPSEDSVRSHGASQGWMIGSLVYVILERSEESGGGRCFSRQSTSHHSAAAALRADVTAAWSTCSQVSPPPGEGDSRIAPTGPRGRRQDLSDTRTPATAQLSGETSSNTTVVPSAGALAMLTTASVMGLGQLRLLFACPSRQHRYSNEWHGLPSSIVKVSVSLTAARTSNGLGVSSQATKNGPSSIPEARRPGRGCGWLRRTWPWPAAPRRLPPCPGGSPCCCPSRSRRPPTLCRWPR